MKRAARDRHNRRIMYLFSTGSILAASLSLSFAALPDDPPASAGQDATICEGKNHPLSDATAPKAARLCRT